jgi:hypothetical protein
LRVAAWGIVEIGRHLLEAKQRVGHGHYLAWIEREFQWGERTAQRYVMVAEEFSNTTRVSDLSFRGLLLLAGDSTPPEVRDEVIERAGEARGLSLESKRWLRNHDLRFCLKLFGYSPGMHNTAVRELAEKVALELLERDGMPVIWLLHVTAAKAHGDGHPRAAETLLEIADAAERCLRRAGVAGPRWQGTSNSGSTRARLAFGQIERMLRWSGPPSST